MIFSHRKIYLIFYLISPDMWYSPIGKSTLYFTWSHLTCAILPQENLPFILPDYSWQAILSHRKIYLTFHLITSGRRYSTKGKSTLYFTWSHLAGDILQKENLPYILPDHTWQAIIYKRKIYLIFYLITLGRRYSPIGKSTLHFTWSHLTGDILP